MKPSLFLLTLLIFHGNACCKQTRYEGFKRDETNNLTSDEDLLENFLTTQRFTAGTLLGLIVASVVVVIGSFLVLYRLCCDVEMVVTREVMEPLNSISQKVSNSPKPSTSKTKTLSRERLLGHGCTSSVLEIA